MDSKYMLRPLFLVGMLFASHIQFSLADEFSSGYITVIDPWARALPAVAKNGAAYFTLSNTGPETDRLISATASIARESQIHTHIMKDGVAKMRQVHAIELPMAESIVLEPGLGFHIMMLSLREPLVSGKTFNMVLHFEQAGEISVVVNVK